MVESAALQSALACLEPEDAACLLLNLVQGYSAGEIARTLRLPGGGAQAYLTCVTTAASRIQQAERDLDRPAAVAGAAGSGAAKRGTEARRLMNMNSHTPAPTPTPLCAVFEPQVALLSSGMLEADEAAAVHEHLATCAYCQLHLNEYQRLREDVLRLLLGSEETSDHARSEHGSVRSQRALIGAAGGATLDRPAYFTLADILQASAEAPPETDERRQAPVHLSRSAGGC